MKKYTLEEARALMDTHEWKMENAKAVNLSIRKSLKSIGDALNAAYENAPNEHITDDSIQANE